MKSMKETEYYKSGRHAEQLKKNRDNMVLKKYQCEHCMELMVPGVIERHRKACSHNPDNIKKCPVCNKEFFRKKSGSLAATCSHSCANRHFKSGKNHPRYTGTAYRTACFAHHKKECVVCGENLVVAVHHMDENHKNNDPKNLVPLCPTHHSYWHSKHRHLIEEKVMQYLNGPVTIVAE